MMCYGGRPHGTSGGCEAEFNQFWMVERDIDNRTSLITDPPDGHTPLTLKRRNAVAGERPRLRARGDRPVVRTERPPLGERCVTFGAPRTGAGYTSDFQIVQSATTIGTLQETIHDARISSVDSRAHLFSSVSQWLGDSRATGSATGSSSRARTTTQSVRFRAIANLKTIERLTRASPDYINLLHRRDAIVDAAHFDGIVIDSIVRSH